MDAILNNPSIQYGAMGLAFVLALALIRAFFALPAHRPKPFHIIPTPHNDHPRARSPHFPPIPASSCTTARTALVALGRATCTAGAPTAW